MPVMTPNGIALPTVEELDQMQRAGVLDLNESRALTSAEMQQARADRRARAAKFKVGDESEARGSGWLSRFFNAEVRKNALRQIQTPAGPPPSRGRHRGRLQAVTGAAERAGHRRGVRRRSAGWPRRGLRGCPGRS